MDIKQRDAKLGIAIDTTLVVGKEKWKITNIGKQVKLKQDAYVPFSAILLDDDNPEQIPELLFWFPEMQTSFKSLEEFENFQKLN